MKKLSAFIDESGDPRYGTGTSETLAYCCVLVEKDKIQEIENNAKEIRTSHGLTQFKSADIDKLHCLNILNAEYWNAFGFMFMFF